MTAKSPVGWAIKRRNGSIAIEERFLRADGTISAGGGFSLKAELHAEVWRRGPDAHHGGSADDRIIGVGGPIWASKRECQRFLWRDEKAVRVRLMQEV